MASSLGIWEMTSERLPRRPEGSLLHLQAPTPTSSNLKLRTRKIQRQMPLMPKVRVWKANQLHQHEVLEMENMKIFQLLQIKCCYITCQHQNFTGELKNCAFSFCHFFCLNLLLLSKISSPEGANLFGNYVLLTFMQVFFGLCHRLLYTGPLLLYKTWLKPGRHPMVLCYNTVHLDP